VKTYRTNKGLYRVVEKSKYYLTEEKKMKKTIIGITSNFTSNDEVEKLAIQKENINKVQVVKTFISGKMIFERMGK